MGFKLPLPGNLGGLVGKTLLKNMPVIFLLTHRCKGKSKLIFFIADANLTSMNIIFERFIWSLILGLLLLLASMLLAVGVLRASRIIYLRLLTNVMHSPMMFFDTTPVGRILNRFSKDTYTIDETIPFACSTFLRMIMLVVSTFIVITWSTPIFGSVIVPVLIGFALLQVCQSPN